MRKFFFKILLYGIIALSAANLIAWGGFCILKNSDIYKPSFLLRNIDRSTAFDYVVLGSSTALTGLDTRIIDSIAQTRGFNLGMDGMGPAGQYMMLQFFFDKGFKTDKMILSIDRESSALASIEQSSMNEFYFLPWIEETYIYDCFKNKESGIVKISAFTKYCPALGFSYYNMQFIGSCVKAVRNPETRWNFDGDGNYFYPATPKFNGDKASGISSDTMRLANPYIEKIIELCRVNNVEPIFFIPPEWKKKTSIEESVVCETINMSDLFNDEPQYFYDPMHVNIDGQRILSEKTAEILTTKKDR